MEITEVRIKLMEDGGDRLQAFCSITFDHSFVVRDLKIIDGSNGPFLAMPSRKLTTHCHRCQSKNHLRANYCNHCGAKIEMSRPNSTADGRVRLYADIAHPIHAACREMIQERVVAAYYEERDQAKLPGYASKYDDIYDDDVQVTKEQPAASRQSLETAASPDQQLHVDPPTTQPPAPHSARSKPPSIPSSAESESEDDFGEGDFDR